MVRGLFIVFEGIDGSGTSTQASMLQSALSKAGLKATLTSEPTNGPIGHLIRQVIAGRLLIATDRAVVDRALAYFFAADRFDHLYNQIDGVVHRLSQGEVVISTRYFLSSYAYNASSEADFEMIQSLNKGFPLPDITFYLECPLHEAMRRILSSGRSPDQNENETILARVQYNYKTALAWYQGRLVRVDAAAPVEEQHEVILRVTRDLLKEGPPSGTRMD